MFKGGEPQVRGMCRGNERAGKGNRAGLMGLMQDRCGRQSRLGGEKEHRWAGKRAGSQTKTGSGR